MLLSSSFHSSVSTVCRALLATFTAFQYTTGTSAAQTEARADTTWQPAVGATWQIVLLNELSDTSLDVDIFDIDVFDNNASVVSELHDKGRKVICYFSGGTYEDWRRDAGDFSETDLGNPLADWEGERWADIRSGDIRKIMRSRLDIAKEKGCDGVDPDNVDGFNNGNGLGLTADDSVDFVNFLADEAHSRGMSIGLKNAGAIIPQVIDNMQWCVNEQCFANENECATFAEFTKTGKPVFHVEYPKGEDVNNDQPVPPAKANEICNNNSSAEFSTLIKNMNLDGWFQTCDAS